MYPAVSEVAYNRPTTPVCHLNPRWRNLIVLLDCAQHMHPTNEDLRVMVDMAIEDALVSNDWPKC
jgi:hypothetical protein